MKHLILSDRQYEIAKLIAQRILPALTTFLGVVIGCFDLALSGIVVTILTAFDAMLGEMLNISTNNYYNADGETPEEEK